MEWLLQQLAGSTAQPVAASSKGYNTTIDNLINNNGTNTSSGYLNNSQQGGLLNSLGGWNGINSLASIIGSVGNLYGAYQSNELAKDQFDFQKQAYNTNLANTIKSYNTALDDRIRSRTVAENGTQADADAYLKKNRL